MGRLLTSSASTPAVQYMSRPQASGRNIYEFSVVVPRKSLHLISMIAHSAIMLRADRNGRDCLEFLTGP